MRLQVLLSAMHLAGPEYIDTLQITTDAVVINQCDRNERIVEERNGRSVLFLSTTERGLSKSRNMAIRESDADVCIFCDNDVVYEPDYEEQILGAFNRNQDADLLVFFIERPERHTPIQEEGVMSYMNTMKVFSPEIAFRRNALRGLCMDERFGAGAEYAMGEENIFLFQAKQRGLTVKYVPVKIAHLTDTESTWFKGYTDKFFRDRGANYYMMSKKWYPLLIWQFALRKRNLYKNDNTMKNALRRMFDGAKEIAGLEGDR